MVLSLINQENKEINKHIIQLSLVSLHDVEGISSRKVAR